MKGSLGMHIGDLSRCLDVVEGVEHERFERTKPKEKQVKLDTGLGVEALRVVKNYGDV